MGPRRAAVPLPGRGVSAESSLCEGMGMGMGVEASGVASVSWLPWPPHVERRVLGGSRLGSDTGGTVCSMAAAEAALSHAF